MFRSEEEQLVGHELIKALRNFKLSPVSPLSPSNRHDSSLNSEAIIVHLKGTQSKLSSNLVNQASQWFEIC
jgi:hypothetical protein